MNTKKIIIICGHYGSGKTNVAVNLAIKSALDNELNVALADLDIVNPYFRAADAAKMLKEYGVTPLIPPLANTNVDSPSLPDQLQFYIDTSDSDTVTYIDVGGDDGAVVLGRYSDSIQQAGYEILYVVNMYRPLTQSPEDVVMLMRETEELSRLRCTGIINNSSVGFDTEYSHVLGSVEYAKKCANLSDLPLLFHSYYEELLPELRNRFNENKYENEVVFPMKNATKNLF